MKDAVALYEELVERELFTSYELDLVIDICGFSVETLNKCIYARYGFQDLEQMLEAWEEE